MNIRFAIQNDMEKRDINTITKDLMINS